MLAGCARGVPSPVVARVGRAVLTLDDLYKNIPPEYGGKISREDNINYVKQWMDTELLYQEALRRKIDREQVIRLRLEKMKKDLLSAEMLSRNAIPDRTLKISDESVHEYYQKHQKEFVRARAMVRYVEIALGSFDNAVQVRKTLTPDNFMTVASRVSMGPLHSLDSVPCMPLNEIPREIREAIDTMKAPGITGPLSMESGYHIVNVLDKLVEGGICGESEVREEIINILSTNAQKAEVDQLISELRLKTDVEFHFDLIPGQKGPSSPENTAGD